MDLNQNINLWVFDLDNTLYPRETNLFAQIDKNMTRFIMEFLELDFDKARKLQKQYYQEHGTTLRGLMDIHKIEPDIFLSAAHDIDYSIVTPQPELVSIIDQLPGRKVILTNGTIKHAEDVIAALGFGNQFSAIYDIAWADFSPKPRHRPYEKLVTVESYAPKEMAFFEDLPRNLEIPYEMGMTTILIDEGRAQQGRENWEQSRKNDNHIHYVTNNLASFLKKLL